MQIELMLSALGADWCINQSFILVQPLKLLEVDPFVHCVLIDGDEHSASSILQFRHNEGIVNLCNDLYVLYSGLLQHEVFKVLLRIEPSELIQSLIYLLS